jgi:hypothetical protein
MDEKKKTYWINRITEEYNKKNRLIWLETKNKYVNGEIEEREVKVISLRH